MDANGYPLGHVAQENEAGYEGADPASPFYLSSVAPSSICYNPLSAIDFRYPLLILMTIGKKSESRVMMSETPA